MHIETFGDESISPQARTYAEYRLFAALSHTLDAARVRHARLVLRRTRPRRRCEAVSCTVTLHLDAGPVVRIRTTGGHPYAAINRAVERLRHSHSPCRPGDRQ